MKGLINALFCAIFSFEKAEILIFVYYFNWAILAQKTMTKRCWSRYPLPFKCFHDACSSSLLSAFWVGTRCWTWMSGPLSAIEQSCILTYGRHTVNQNKVLLCAEFRNEKKKSLEMAVTRWESAPLIHNKASTLRAAALKYSDCEKFNPQQAEGNIISFI